MKLALIMSTVALSLSTAAQTSMFSVQNDKNVKYSEVEAMKGYVDATSAVEHEFHLTDHVAPTFTLVLGGDQGVWFATKDKPRAELHLTKFDVRYFRQGVLVLATNELLKPERIAALEYRIEREQNAKVDVESLKK